MTPTQTLPRKAMSRKARFRASLGLARMTAEEWASEHGVSGGHLSRVIAGERDSAELIAKVDAFIAKQLGEERVA